MPTDDCPGGSSQLSESGSSTDSVDVNWQRRTSESNREADDGPDAIATGPRLWPAVGLSVAESARTPNRLLRRARGGMSQAKLADLVSAEIYRATGKDITITAKAISDYECGWYTWPSADVRGALRRIFNAATDADLGFYWKRTAQAPQPAAAVSLSDLMHVKHPPGETSTVTLPAGRSFAGAEILAHYCKVIHVGTDWLLVDSDRALDRVLTRPDRRSLVVAAGDDQHLYVADGRRFVDRGGRRTGPQPISSATFLDDLTMGIIWATMNADIAMLADDAQLDRAQARIAPYEERASSDVGLDAVASLGPVSAQWLGSRFCARHITRHLDRVGGLPFFWTRERRGEEAASWLLWSHKFDYLRRTARWFPRMRRGFCIPEADVAASPGYERVLLLLAMALMEAFEISVELSPEPEHAEVEGFVLGEEAIVANWLGGSGVWYVDASAPASRRSVYRDIDSQLASDSLIDQPTSEYRLAAAASYLNVPWQWFVRRCEELAAAGVTEIANPRSRLLSTRGLETAIRYVAYLDTLEGAGLARR
ncbi:hypothetical protein [Kribbella sp. NPDC055071]